MVMSGCVTLWGRPEVSLRGYLCLDMNVLCEFLEMELLEKYFIYLYVFFGTKRTHTMYVVSSV